MRVGVGNAGRKQEFTKEDLKDLLIVSLSVIVLGSIGISVIEYFEEEIMLIYSSIPDILIQILEILGPISVIVSVILAVLISMVVLR